LADFARNFLTWSVISRTLAGEAPSIDLVLGYHKANTSPLLKLFLSRTDQLVARVSADRQDSRWPTSSTGIEKFALQRTEPIPLPRWRSAMGHQGRFAPPSLRDRCPFGEGTFAGTRAIERDAPIPDLPALAPLEKLWRVSSCGRQVEGPGRASLYLLGTRAGFSANCRIDDPRWRALQTPSYAKKPLPQFIIAPRAQASRRCETPRGLSRHKATLSLVESGATLRAVGQFGSLSTLSNLASVFSQAARTPAVIAVSVSGVHVDRAKCAFSAFGVKTDGAHDCPGAGDGSRD
jgi:hypothetical protein